MSDQEVDDLFKEAAGKYTPPDDSKAWENMSSLLDKAASKSAAPWTIKGLSLVAILVLFSDTSLMEQNENMVFQSNGVETIQVDRKLNHDAINEDEINKEVASAEQETEEQALVEKRKLETNHDIGGAEKMKQNRIQKNEVANVNSFKQPRGQREITYRKGTDHKPQQVNDTITIVPFRNQQEQFKNVYLPNEINGEIISNRKAILQDSAAEKKVIEEEKSVSDSTRQEKKEDKKKDKSVGRLSLKLAASPDLTSVGYFSPGKLGLNYGLLVEYSFSEHWSITTGALRSRKKYSNSEQNEDPYGYVTTNNMDGQCYMLDIPVNIQYYFTPGKKYSLYAGIGVSSYIMSKEEYSYSASGSSGYYSYDKSVKNKNSEWFKVMNISLGLQRKFSNRIYVQVEPFVKAPFATLGEAKIKMVSTGAFVQVKYILK